ncbi:MAG: DegT/DnrJ/EryC1/StrS family aminotransferase [Puniceicoccales bacterium]|jgi:CDP-6-deoxy-D-xylo-4-hexulose-3-dehydrase|nr:DegT/DnrJ/EryC1/StrS family aminotransferase [Puniceicoccales bacterium]
MSKKYRYPCTRKVTIDGFAAFLEANIATSRQNINDFANELGARFGAGKMTLVNSGSSANLVAALTLAEQLKAEGRPLAAFASAYTFPTTLSALLMAGFSIRLLDTEADGFNLCPLALEKAFSRHPATLVCVTHFLGFPAKMAVLAPIARKNGAKILQDACETMNLRTTDGKPMHTLGDMTTWSFYHPHHLSSYGGGAAISNETATHELADSIAHWGRACTCHINPSTCRAPAGFSHNFTYLRPGLNVEMSELNACFGRFQLRQWDAMEQARKERYATLYDALSGLSGITVYPADEKQGSPFVFPITCNGMDAAKAVEKLGTLGMECRSLMGGAMTEQPAFKALPNDGNANAKTMARGSFFVGIHQTLPLDDVRDMASLLRSIF